MKKLLMLGTSKASCEMIEYAKSQGIYTIVTDYLAPEKSKAKLIADEYWMISTGDFDTLEKKCREEHIDGVCSGISTFCIPATMELCKRLGLQAYCTPESWHYTMNKYDFKALCRSCNVPVATDYFVSNPPTEEELNNIKFPVVVKAVDQSANRGMSYCHNKEEILPAIEYAHSFSKDSKVVIERMLKGVEYTAYYALVKGEASLVSLFSDLAQPGTPNNCYAVNSTACDKLDVYLKEVDPYFRQALKQEINMPLKRLGRMMILSIAMAVGFYALVVLAIGYVMNGNQMVTSMQGAGLVTADAMAIAFNSHTMAKVLILGGLCGIITSWNSFLIGGSRVMFAMAKSRMIPSSFAKLHPVYKTPIVALLLLGLTSIITPFFGRVMLVWIVDAANFACCLAYCIVSLSFVVLRKKKADLKRPYRVGHAYWVGIMAVLMSGFMAAMYLIPGSACTLVWQEMVIVVGWTLLGIFLGIRGKIVYKDSFASGMDI